MGPELQQQLADDVLGQRRHDVAQDQQVVEQTAFVVGREAVLHHFDAVQRAVY